MDPLVTCTLIIAILVLLYRYVTKNNNYWNTLCIPFARPIPLFGNVLPFLQQTKCPAFFFMDLYNSATHSLYGFFLLRTPALLIRDPELIKYMFVRDFDSFRDRPGGHCDHDKVGANTLFFMKSPTWKEMRSSLSPFFSPHKLEKMSETIFQFGDQLVDHIKEKVSNQDEISAFKALSMYTSDIIASCFFGLAVNSLKNGNLWFQIMSESLTKASYMRFVESTCVMLLPRFANFFNMTFFDRTSTENLINLFTNAMEERKRSTYSRGDLVDLLINISEGGAKVFRKEEILAQALQLQFGGYETSSNTINLALYELCLHPHVQARLRKEVSHILLNHQTLSLDVIREMKYLDMVVSESLRKHPILPVIDRECTISYKIPNTDVVIEKGTPCYVSVFGLHYDSEFFPNPEKFDPERFSPENKCNIVSGSYLPFGIGPRRCIGTNLGLIIVKVALIKIIHNFEVQLCETEKRKIEYNSKRYLTGHDNKSEHMKFVPLHKSSVF
ncbi:hypothetical protein RI129_005377 [Pyrocoelia pectoralis]|uniref:Cytochrome P450 n=1 Tax=Pyrocoelia pectoralis TaxID=417401 RepID=A0AAN7ZSA2_9COLE